MVPRAGVEPARLAARDFKSRASTNFATRAADHYRPLCSRRSQLNHPQWKLEAGVGIEPGRFLEGQCRFLKFALALTLTVTLTPLPEVSIQFEMNASRHEA